MRVNNIPKRTLDILALAAVCVLLCPGGAIMLFSSIALHEAAHIAALLAFKTHPSSFSAIGPGFRITYAAGMLSRTKRLAVALSGAAVNLLLAVISAFAGSLFFSAINLILAAFNLLPVRGLDGGEALSIIISNDTHVREALLKTISTLTVLALWIFSIFLQLRVAPTPEPVVVSTALLVRELV